MLEQLNKELSNKTKDANSEIMNMQRKVERILKPRNESRKNRKLNEERMEPNVNLSTNQTDSKREEGSIQSGAEMNKEEGANSNERKDEMKLRHDRSRKKRFRSMEEIDRVTRELKSDINDDDNDAEEIGVSCYVHRFSYWDQKGIFVLF